MLSTSLILHEDSSSVLNGDGKTFNEVSQELGVTLTTARSLIATGLKALLKDRELQSLQHINDEESAS